MATTQFGTNHNLAVKLWAKKLFTESLAETYFSRFLGKGSDSLVQWKDETKKSAGDRVRVGLRMQLSGTGIQGDNTLEGSEESLVTFSDDLTINQLRHACRSDGRMSEQRVLFDVLNEHKDALTDWYANRLDTSFFNQLAGYTAESDTRYTGNNATVAPSTNNIIWADSDVATGDESIGTTDTFTTAMLDRAVTKAKTMDASGQPIIRPFRISGQEKYVAFLHPHQVYNLRRESTANTVTWWEVNRSALSGGLSEGASALYKGSLGEYNGIILHESNRVPLGVNSVSSASISTVRRGIFCGAQAALFATGRESQDPSAERMSFRMEEFDYGNQQGVEVGMIFGLKKTVFNSKDFATIVMSSYATAP
jgi:N4-gp56 family major capsid protein